MSKKKPRVWQTADGDFIGATGVNSVEEFARAINESPEREAFFDILFAEDGLDVMVEEQVLGQIIHKLNYFDVCALRVPAVTFHNERWETDWPMAMSDKPGRGYVKVLGVSF